MAERKLLINATVYNNQLGAIVTALSEIDEHNPESFQIFLDRMVELGVIVVG